MDIPVFILINKIDLAQDQAYVGERIAYWQSKIPGPPSPPSARCTASTLTSCSNESWSIYRSALRISPRTSYEQPMRFFISEIVRKKSSPTSSEIPYSCEVVVDAYVQEDNIVKIRAEMRRAKVKKQIVIGKGGSMIKRVGTDARRNIEKFIGQRVFLDLYVKVDKDWRDDERKLKRLGYLE